MIEFIAMSLETRRKFLKQSVGAAGVLGLASGCSSLPASDRGEITPEDMINQAH